MWTLGVNLRLLIRSRTSSYVCTPYKPDSDRMTTRAGATIARWRGLEARTGMGAAAAAQGALVMNGALPTQPHPPTQPEVLAVLSVLRSQAPTCVAAAHAPPPWFDTPLLALHTAARVTAPRLPRSISREWRRWLDGVALTELCPECTAGAEATRELVGLRASGSRY